jgi:PTS system ascorbate-specific IIA component
MISLLIIAHGNLGESLIQCATHILGKRPESLENLDLGDCEDLIAIEEQAQTLLRDLDHGEGVLILTDVYGATPCNMVCRLVAPHQHEAVSGVNLPMLLKALTYRDQGMDALLAKAISGGQAGIFHIPSEQTVHA